VRLGVKAAAALSVFFVLSAAPQVAAQAPQSLPPLPGFVPPYEISRIVRSAGLAPLAPPLREGAAYVVRAVDFRGTLMRVVVDGRSGAIRAVNRIVAASEIYGPMVLPAPPYGLPPSYAEPLPEFPPGMGPYRESAVPDLPPPAASLAPLPPASRPGTSAFPPLPRPRPAELASSKAADQSRPAVGKPAGAVPAPAAAVPQTPPPAGPLPD
jgi:hypothetical protein